MHECSLVPRPHPASGDSSLVTIEGFLGSAESAFSISARICNDVFVSALAVVLRFAMFVPRLQQNFSSREVKTALALESAASYLQVGNTEDRNEKSSLY